MMQGPSPFWPVVITGGVQKLHHGGLQPPPASPPDWDCRSGHSGSAPPAAPDGDARHQTVPLTICRMADDPAPSGAGTGVTLAQRPIVAPEHGSGAATPPKDLPRRSSVGFCTLGGLSRKVFSFESWGVILFFFFFHMVLHNRPENRQKETTSSLQGAMAVHTAPDPRPDRRPGSSPWQISTHWRGS